MIQTRPFESAKKPSSLHSFAPRPSFVVKTRTSPDGARRAAPRFVPAQTWPSASSPTQ